MENTPAVDEVVVPKKNVLFEVTPTSRILAGVLFIALPFIGGWIGYTYGKNNSVTMSAVNTELKIPTQIVAPELNTQENATPETNNMNWLTASAMADGKEITIQYPKEIPVNVTVLEENKALGGLGIDPGAPNYRLPLTSSEEVLVAELTTDLRYIFFLKRDTPSDTVSLYKATVSMKTVEKIPDFTYSLAQIKEELNSGWSSTFMPQVTGDFIVYNPQPASNGVGGVIISTDNNTSMYEAPCALDPFGNVDISPDNLHIAWNCDGDALYISDWKNTKKLIEYSESSMRPFAVSFMNNERIKFANGTEDNGQFRAPYRSVKIDGSDLRLEEGDVYLGY